MLNIQILPFNFSVKSFNIFNATQHLFKLTELPDAALQVDNTLNIGVDLFKFIVAPYGINAAEFAQQYNIAPQDLLTSAAALIGCFIAYAALHKGLLRFFVSSVDPIARNYSPSTINEYKNAAAQQVKKYSLLIKIFNRITIPMLRSIVTYFLYLGFIIGTPQDPQDLLTKGVKKQLGNAAADAAQHVPYPFTGGVASVSFLGKKRDMLRSIGKWILLIFIVGVYWFIKTCVIPAYKIEYPESYNYISTIISNYGLYILLNSLFLWCFGLCILYAIEIYVFLLYSIKKEGIKIPKFLPQLTKNWLKNLEEDSKCCAADNKEAYVHMYCRNLLIHLLVVLIIVFIKFWFLV